MRLTTKDRWMLVDALGAAVRDAQNDALAFARTHLRVSGAGPFRGSYAELLLLSENLGGIPVVVSTEEKCDGYRALIRRLQQPQKGKRKR